MWQSPSQGSADSVPVSSLLCPATRSLSAFASSAKSFIYRFYAKSLANSFIYRIYANTPGCGGLSSAPNSKNEGQSNKSFASYYIHPTLAVSMDYALFCATGFRYLPFFQSVPHSFDVHGGGTHRSSNALAPCFGNSVPAIRVLAIAYHECTSYVSEEFPSHGLNRNRSSIQLRAAPASRAARTSLDRHILHGQPRFHAHALALGARLRRHRLLPLPGFSDLRPISPATRRTSFTRQDRQLRQGHDRARESRAVWQRSADQRRRFLAPAAALEQSRLSPRKHCALCGDHRGGGRDPFGIVEDRRNAQHPQRHDECHAAHRLALTLRHAISRAHENNRARARSHHGQLYRIQFHRVFPAHSYPRAQAPLSRRRAAKQSRLRLDCQRARETQVRRISLARWGHARYKHANWRRASRNRRAHWWAKGPPHAPADRPRPRRQHHHRPP